MKTESKRLKTNDALEIMERMMGDAPEMQRLVDEARVNVSVAQLIFQSRERAGLTQKELAELIGTKQPVIARLEDANYAGHSLSMLQRIAKALNQKLEIRLTPLPKKAAA